MKKALVALFFISTSAHAFVTPPAHFFNAWVNQNKSVQILLIKQEKDFLVQGAVSQTVPETIKIKKPGLFKISSFENGQEEIKLVGKTKAMLGTPQTLRQVKLQDVITPLEASILYNQVGTFESVLNQIDIDAKQYGLELFRHQPRIRVGSKDGNRIYISSATNLIDAMIYKNRFYVFTYDINAVFKNYPTTIEVFDGDVLKEKIRVISVSTTAKISDQEFESK